MSESIKLENNTYWDQTSIKHDLIKVRSTQNQTITTAGTLDVTFDTVDLNIGNSFELLVDKKDTEDKDHIGKVKVTSSNVHHVRVTSVMWVERGGSSYALCRNTKNGENVGQYIVPKVISGEYWHSVSIVSVFDVSKGDYIYPHIYFPAASSANKVCGGTYYNSVYLIVEAID